MLGFCLTRDLDFDWGIYLPSTSSHLISFSSPPRLLSYSSSAASSSLHACSWVVSCVFVVSSVFSSFLLLWCSSCSPSFRFFLYYLFCSSLISLLLSLSSLFASLFFLSSLYHSVSYLRCFLCSSATSLRFVLLSCSCSAVLSIFVFYRLLSSSASSSLLFSSLLFSSLLFSSLLFSSRLVSSRLFSSLLVSSRLSSPLLSSPLLSSPLLSSSFLLHVPSSIRFFTLFLFPFFLWPISSSLLLSLSSSSSTSCFTSFIFSSHPCSFLCLLFLVHILLLILPLLLSLLRLLLQSYYISCSLLLSSVFFVHSPFFNLPLRCSSSDGSIIFTSVHFNQLSSHPSLLLPFLFRVLCRLRLRPSLLHLLRLLFCRCSSSLFCAIVFFFVTRLSSRASSLFSSLLSHHSSRLSSTLPFSLLPSLFAVCSSSLHCPPASRFLKLSPCLLMLQRYQASAQCPCVHRDRGPSSSKWCMPSHHDM